MLKHLFSIFNDECQAKYEIFLSKYPWYESIFGEFSLMIYQSIKTHEQN